MQGWSVGDGRCAKARRRLEVLVIFETVFGTIEVVAFPDLSTKVLVHGWAGLLGGRTVVRGRTG